MKGIVETINTIKVELSKELPIENIEEDSTIEKCRDLLQQLKDIEEKMTLSILQKTLIGTVVSKFKSHSELGPDAKALVKAWKKVAKASAPPASSTSAATTTTTTTKEDEKEDLLDNEDYLSLDSQRQSIAKKFHDVLSIHKNKQPTLKEINSNAFQSLVICRCLEIEQSLTTKFYNTDKTEYINKARSLCFNIKKNGTLTEKLLLGSLSSNQLLELSIDELASVEKQQQKLALTKKVTDSKRLDWDQANEDKINEMCGIKGDLLQASLFTCGRCKSVKTTSTQKQTRSADEPMTVFVFCLNCGNRWKC